MPGTEAQEITDKKPWLFKPGHKPVRQNAGLQSFKQRLEHFWNDYSVAEIDAMVKNKRKWKGLAARDAAIIQRIAQAKEITGIEDMKLLLDRLLGKAVQPITGEDGKALIPEVDILEIARRTAYVLALAQQQQLDAPQTLLLPDSRVTPSEE